MKTVILTILVFGFLIFIHEFGHYITARLCKVQINEFSLGMGPKIFGFRSKKTGILYAVRALPIGGYVSMEGENGNVEGISAEKTPKPILLSSRSGVRVPPGVPIFR